MRARTSWTKWAIGRAPLRRLVVALGPAAGVILSGPVAAAAQPSAQGYSVAASTTPFGAVAPGGRLTIQFQFTNGNTPTGAPLTAWASAPDGTTLVEHTQSCGTSGGSCSESFGGPKLTWEVPAGSPAGAVSVFSFAVTVPVASGGNSIAANLTFSGPGCSANQCTVESPPVVVGRDPGLSAQFSTLHLSRSSGLPTESTDTQNVSVVVPHCKSAGGQIKCGGPGSRGKGNQGNGNGNPGGGQGHQATTTLPGRLAFTSRPTSGRTAFTGAELMLNAGVGLLALLLGGALLLVSRYRRRRTRLLSPPG